MLDAHTVPEAQTHTDAEPLFMVNPKAAPMDVAEFVNVSQGCIAEMLDSAVLNDGMSGKTAWLLEQVFQIREAAIHRLLQRA